MLLFCASVVFFFSSVFTLVFVSVFKCNKLKCKLNEKKTHTQEKERNRKSVHVVVIFYRIYLSQNACGYMSLGAIFFLDASQNAICDAM